MYKDLMEEFNNTGDYLYLLIIYNDILDNINNEPECMKPEELTVIIQNYGKDKIWNTPKPIDYYWEVLYNYSIPIMKSVKNKRSGDIYKLVYNSLTEEDVMTILRMGWIKAVKTYDLSKATAPFAPYAYIRMDYEYIRLVSQKFTSTKSGKSVHSISYECFGSNEDDYDNHTDYVDNLLVRDDSEDLAKQFELADYINSKVRELRKLGKIEDSKILNGTFFENKKQVDMAEELQLHQSNISKRLTKIYNYLRDDINQRGLDFN